MLGQHISRRSCLCEWSRASRNHFSIPPLPSTSTLGLEFPPPPSLQHWISNSPFPLSSVGSPIPLDGLSLSAHRFAGQARLHTSTLKRGSEGGRASQPIFNFEEGGAGVGGRASKPILSDQACERGVMQALQGPPEYFNFIFLLRSTWCAAR